MIEVGFIQGIARDAGELIRAPLTGRTCLEYRVVVTRTRFAPPAALEVPWETIIHVESGFTPWVLEEVRCTADHFDRVLDDALSAHGDGDGGFDVLAPLVERAQTASARHWRLASGDPSRQRRAEAASFLALLGTIGLPFLIADLVARNHTLLDYALHELAEVIGANNEERLLRKLGLGADLEASRSAHAAGEGGYTYGISEHIVRPGDRVHVYGATAVSRAIGSEDYRSAGVRHGLVAGR